MAKGEISWTRKSETGERVEISVRHLGGRWTFYSRERRPEDWQVVDAPPLEDWLNLLDAVERRVGRQLIKPDEVERIKKTIRERFPEVKLPG